MAINYTWDVSTVDTFPTKDSKADVIHQVHWKLTATDDTNNDASGNPQTAFVSERQPLDTSDLSSFTAFASNGGLNPSSGQSWHNGTNTQNNNLTFLANISYTHTDGFTYVPNSPVVPGDTSTYPTTNLGGSLPVQQSAYDAVGIKLQGT